MTEIVRTWVYVAVDRYVIIQGQRPDNGDWRLLQVHTDDTDFTLIPVLDDTGTARIRMIREPDE